MRWQTQEHQSTTILDEALAEELGEYLEVKELQLSKQIIQLLSLVEEVPSLAPSDTAMPSRLGEAVEEFSRKVRKAGRSTTAALTNREQWKLTVIKMNGDLWQYVEVLEGCVKELFQQHEQIGFEQWNADLARAMTSIKDELTHRIDDLTWAIRRLEEQLKEYQLLCKFREGKWMRWQKVVFSWQKVLDKQLVPTLSQCNKYLNLKYRKFIESYTGYLQMYEGVQKQVQKVNNFRILSSLDLDRQDKYKHLYLLLKLWQQNNKSLILSRTETLRAVRSFAAYPVAVSIFKEYLSSIKKAAFDKSRMIKKQFRLLFIDKVVRQPLLDNLSGYRNELSVLNDVIKKYVKFHEHTDPKSRNRSNSNNSSFEELHKFIREIHELDLQIVNFHSSLECDPTMDRRITPELLNEINRNLHEMGQPLASQELMRRDAKVLLSDLHGLDEMGTFDPKVVGFTRNTLIKAMCTDWKYHVLQEMPLFHHVYRLHQNIVGESNKAHFSRLGKFQGVLDQLSAWITNKETLKHAHDIELDINDLKGYFQDFLAHVQRLEKRPEDLLEAEINEHPVTKTEEALLESLYIFGKFFHQLHLNDPEHRLIRKQLLFVDQYFDAIARKLHDL